MPLHYHLVLEALANLQRSRDYRLAIVHAETAFEVYVAASLNSLLVALGHTEAEAQSLIENNDQYWGIKKKLRRLDDHSKTYAGKTNLVYSPFLGTTLAKRWEKDLYAKRNRAVHAGISSFTYDEASAGIGVAKESIVFLETRIPTLANHIQLNPSMSQFKQNSGEVNF
jgi:hypothetical protein